MNNSIQLVQQDSNLSAPRPPINHYDLRWLNFFDPYRALQDVTAHIAALPSSDNPEQHTLRAYADGIRVFLEWGYNLIHNTAPGNDEIIHPLPDKPLITRFIAYLKTTGRGSSTIASKYLAPLRHYLRALHEQNNNMPEQIDDLMYWMLCKENLRSAEKVKAPRPEKSTSLSPLFAHGQRFSLKQANATLRQIDRDTLAGARDYALLLLGFSTGLRVAELARLTRFNIQAEGEVWLIKDLRGKRNNYDPIPLAPNVVESIDAYITMHNDLLEADDPRRIMPDSPIWQPVNRAGNLYTRQQRPNSATPLANKSIAHIIAKRTKSATGIRLAPHDLRRTCTAIADEAGMSRKEIRRIVRHKSVAQTDHYIGDGKPDWSKSVLGYRVQLG